VITEIGKMTREKIEQFDRLVGCAMTPIYDEHDLTHDVIDQRDPGTAHTGVGYAIEQTLFTKEWTFFCCRCGLKLGAIEWVK
jgi:hypothetical protein